MIKTIITSAITAIVVVVFAILSGLVSDNQPHVAGASGSRLPNGISADNILPVAGQVRGTTLAVTGGPDKLGAANTVFTMYFGAADGCSAVRFNSSSTLTTTATSTSFCN